MKVSMRKWSPLGLILVAMIGCGPRTLSPVDGKVLFEPGIDFQFAGDTLEIRSENSPSDVGYGEIKPDGSFTIESLRDGEIVNGAPPGSYRARIVIADDDYDHKAAALKAVPKKYLSFETSGFSLDAPSRGVTLTISK